jgi:Amt family ammonium transporter
MAVALRFSLALGVAAQTNAELLEQIQTLKADTETAMSHMWLIVCGALVMFMHAGFAMLESGCCRANFAQSVLAKNLLNCCVSTVGWWLLGWGVAYGDVPQNGFIGHEQFAWNMGFGTEQLDSQSGVVKIVQGDDNLNWFFQWAFCMTSATIVSGAVAERLQLGGYCLFCLLMTAFVYPVVVAWTWSLTGWLNNVGGNCYMDFAGSGIVHLTGGTGALVGAIITGRRKGRFEEGVDQSQFDPHNVSFVALGTIILWFGWYGFNCGSTLGMSKDKGRLAAQVAVNTTLAAASSGLLVGLVRRAQTHKWSTVSMCGGILAGLVSITAPCGNVHTYFAPLIGAIGGLIYMAAGDLIRKLKIDDPVEAVPVHGACGIWGVLAAAIFDWGPGKQYHAWYGFEPTPDATKAGGLAANVVGIIAIMAWSGSMLTVIFSALKALNLLRISEEAELLGDEMKFAPQAAYLFTSCAAKTNQSTPTTLAPSSAGDGFSAYFPTPDASKERRGSNRSLSTLSTAATPTPVSEKSPAPIEEGVNEPMMMV